MKNKKIISYLGIFSAILLILSAVFRALTPYTQEIPTTEFSNINNEVISQTTADFSNVTFTGKEIVVPDKLSINKVTQVEDENELISKIISTHNLKTDVKSERYWTNDRGQYLHQDIYSKKYQLAINNSSNSNLLKKMSLEQIINAASSEVLNLFPTLKLNPLIEKISFLKNSVEFYEETTFNEADIIRIPFSYTIDSYPLRYKKQSNDTFTVILDGMGKVNRIDFSPLFISIQVISQNQTISTEQAIININNNQGSIINFGFEQGTKADLSTIKSANLDNAQIEYRYDEQVGLAYPFYRFSGEGTDLTNQKIKLEIITPAIETSPTE